MSNKEVTSNKEIMSDITKTFRFYDILDNDETRWCDVEINIKELVYTNGTMFYDISYKYCDYLDLIDLDSDSDNDNDNDNGNYNHANCFIKNKANPFYYKRNIITQNMIDGVIIAKNSMTDEMVKYLLMDYEELDQYIGNTWTVLYKANIMFAFAFMWD